MVEGTITGEEGRIGEKEEGGRRGKEGGSIYIGHHNEKTEDRRDKRSARVRGGDF